MESFLEKKSPVLVKGWQKRYFLYCENLLLYFKDKVDLPPYQPKGVILKQNIVQVDYLDATKNEFIVYAGSRKFILRAENKEIKEQWLDALKVEFNQAQKSKTQLKQMSKTKWEEISEEQRIKLYLRREQILKELISKKSIDSQQAMIKSSNIASTISEMGKQNLFIVHLLEKDQIKIN